MAAEGNSPTLCISYNRGSRTMEKICFGASKREWLLKKKKVVGFSLFYPPQHPVKSARDAASYVICFPDKRPEERSYASHCPAFGKLRVPRWRRRPLS